MQRVCSPATPTVRGFAACRLRAPQLGLAVPCSSRRRLACRAEEQQQQGSSGAAAEQPASPTPPMPPVDPGTVAPWNRTPSQIDMASQPDALGPVGNFFMAVLLIFLCGASFFSTVGRQFQADLVPLTPEQLAQMQ